MSIFKKIVTASSILLGLIILISFTNFTWLQSARMVLLSFIYLFLPGYTLSLFIFKEAEMIERMTMSMALSLVLLPLLHFYASLYQIYIHKSLLTMIIILAAIAALILRSGFFGGQKN